MPKKKNQESQAEQSERFKSAVRDLVAAGELNRAEADHAFQRTLAKVSVVSALREH